MGSQPTFWKAKSGKVQTIIPALGIPLHLFRFFYIIKVTKTKATVNNLACFLDLIFSLAQLAKA